MLKESEMYFTNPSFASGSVTVVHIFDKIISGAYRQPYLMNVIKLLVSAQVLNAEESRYSGFIPPSTFIRFRIYGFYSNIFTNTWFSPLFLHKWFYYFWQQYRGDEGYTPANPNTIPTTFMVKCPLHFKHKTFSELVRLMWAYTHELRYNSCIHIIPFVDPASQSL